MKYAWTFALNGPSVTNHIMGVSHRSYTVHPWFLVLGKTAHPVCRLDRYGCQKTTEMTVELMHLMFTVQQTLSSCEYTIVHFTISPWVLVLD